jgi:predicted lysophospholipase L1 biosynthesis ABC-type transport system permease subunit
VSRLRERWQRTGLQTRVTVLVAAAVAVALLAGALLLVYALRAGLTGAVDDRARQRATEVERLVVEGGCRRSSRRRTRRCWCRCWTRPVG